MLFAHVPLTLVRPANRPNRMQRSLKIDAGKNPGVYYHAPRQNGATCDEGQAIPHLFAVCEFSFASENFSQDLFRVFAARYILKLPGRTSVLGRHAVERHDSITGHTPKLAGGSLPSIGVGTRARNVKRGSPFEIVPHEVEPLRHRERSSPAMPIRFI